MAGMDDSLGVAPRGSLWRHHQHFKRLIKSPGLGREAINLFISVDNVSFEPNMSDCGGEQSLTTRAGDWRRASAPMRSGLLPGGWQRQQGSLLPHQVGSLWAVISSSKHLLSPCDALPAVPSLAHALTEFSQQH